MFNKIYRMIKSPKHDVHTFVSVALPAIESTNSEGKYKVVVDPDLSAQSILDTLLENWDEEDVKENMLSRFIAVLSDDPIRNAMIDYKANNFGASQDQIDTAMQQFADAGWNINLKHPSTPKKQESQAKKGEKVASYVSVMATDQKAEFFAKQLEADPELQAHIDKLVALKAKTKK